MTGIAHRAPVGVARRPAVAAIPAARPAAVRAVPARPARRARLVGALLIAAIALDALVVLALPIGAHALAEAQATQQHVAAVHAAQTAAARSARGGTVLQDPSAPRTATRSSATPERIVIPSIDVDASVERLARDSEGVLQPPTAWADAGWYANGVVPGDTGAAVIAGHLDTTKRAAVFVALRFLRPGDDVQVRMSDGRTLHFRVDRARVVQKALFPSALVYGATPDAQLRLITCSEPFDEAQGIYADNLVVFATLTSTTR